MKEQLKIYEMINSISISIFIFIMSVVIGVLGIQSTSKEVDTVVVQVLLTIILSGFLYFIIKNVTRMIYVPLLLKFKYKCNIGGEWYHIHVYGVGKNIGKIRVGTVTIKQNIFDIVVCGCNHDYILSNTNEVIEERSHQTLWEYSACDFDPHKKKLTGFYTAKRTYEEDEENKNKEGVHELYVYNKNGKKANHINGKFCDTMAGGGMGTIDMFRSKAKRDECLLKCLNQ